MIKKDKEKTRAMTIRFNEEFYNEMKMEADKIDSTLNGFIKVILKIGLNYYTGKKS